MFGQTEIDNLEKLLRQTDDPSERLKIYSKLIYEYGFIDPIKARIIADEAISLSENEKNSRIRADLFNSIGIAYHMNGNFIV
ncbi:MAG: hypothetical protein KFF73_11915, partial [Cyclobacteriaceae bacterium]|nr:hypothetical protein [Cyclobacteriaceae bacterium]